MTRRPKRSARTVTRGAPAHDVRVSSDGARSPLGRARVQAIAGLVLDAQRSAPAVVAITFVSERAIARLNRLHLGHSGPTDIVTFEHATGGAVPVVGDIYIAPQVAGANARAFGVGVREETARLVIHGVLHALGMEHPEGAPRTGSPMWRRQEALLRRAIRAGLV
jgi:probable rRNA maturation factor